MTMLDDLRAAVRERYRIERELGRGGMGAVYLARDVRLDRPVAIKVLPAEYASQPSLRERFLRETRTAAGFSHPNIVPVYAVEESADLLAYVMGFVEGESLTDRVKRAGPLSVRETVRLLQDVAYALAYAHGRGVVHRDIKPDNIMIERATGRALVMDFGVARAIAEAPAGAPGLTRVGEVVGTPEYMSPEQATAEPLDGRSDIYSLGLVAYFAVTGKIAVGGDSAARILARQLTEPLPSVLAHRPDLPPALAEAIERCANKEPEARFPSAEALVEALDLAQLATPEIPLPLRLFAQELGTLSMVLVGGGLIAWVLWQANAKQEFVNLDTLLPLLMLAGVLFTRVLQTLSEARRLARAGFSAADIRKGLWAVVEERAQRRAQLASDPETRGARRRTLVWAALLIVGALALGRAAFAFRREVAPHYYTTSTPGVILVFSAAIMLGIGIVLLMRSPFRMPMGERLFRVVWIGPVGRGFLRVASRGVNTATAGTMVSAVGRVAVQPAPRTPSPLPSDRVASLEARIEALERKLSS